MSHKLSTPPPSPQPLFNLPPFPSPHWAAGSVLNNADAVTQVTAKDDELAGRDAQLSAALREAAVINEQYISDLSAGQQQLESEVASLTAQLDTATAAAAERAQQEADMQTAHKRLRGQVGLACCCSCC